MSKAHRSGPRRTRFAVAAALGAAIGTVLLSAGCAEKSDYPAKAVKVIVPFGPGGPSDVNARLIAEHAKAQFPKGIAVTNVPGGSATTGTYQGVSSEPDGYTWIYGGTSELSSVLHTVEAPYTMDSYRLVLKVGNMPTVLLVKKDPRWPTLAAFIDHAKANPGAVKVGTPGDASFNRLMGEQLAAAAGINLVMVPFNGNAAVVQGLLGGHIQAGLVNSPDARAHVKDGSEIAGLAVFSAKRVASIPTIPTTREQGVDLVGTISHYIAVPKQTPDAVVAAIEKRLKPVLADPAYVKAAEAIAFEADVQDAAVARSELTRWYETAGTLYGKLGMLKKKQ
ncbi:hypothetical protein RHODGE_RHODGE_02355 [Rhodoplanes serenus]|uniref:Tripartite tricarboxylate transporter substrate binding protein n=1 Tax=Rhodoplanes serenus TaxID=200615 RepID=A0A447CVF4_9BRAD|nr:tripartite tricarboxylate transporter substrate binding protein [Rhodoplanes serenus]VCU09183.1 hypothetical protein RHODGE_RHODGE_02355 [Rhodoplanes serenus]